MLIITIFNCYKKLVETGDLNDLPRIPSQPTNRKIIRAKAKHDIGEMIQGFPKLSIEKLRVATKVSHGLAQSVLRTVLGLFPYTSLKYKRIPKQSFPLRLKFANWFLELPIKTQKILICCHM